jgi:hypothetical protein
MDHGATTGSQSEGGGRIAHLQGRCLAWEAKDRRIRKGEGESGEGCTIRASEIYHAAEDDRFIAVVATAQKDTGDNAQQADHAPQ